MASCVHGMDQSRLREIEARCTQEAMPRCRARCPLRLDVRAFMERMSGGELSEARKVLERHLPLPEILARICDHPCEDRCLRRDLGGSLAIGALEAMCVDNTEKQGKSLPRPPRAASVAVLGNALAGLVVAFELSRKAYPVTIFHEGEAGDALLRRFPQLAAACFQREYASLLKAGCVFVRRRLDRALLEEAGQDFAALFVDADAAPDIFAGLDARPDPATGLVAEKICAGGMPLRSPTGAPYVSSSRQAGEGRRAAVTLERHVTGVSLTAMREGECADASPLHTPLKGIRPLEAIPPPEGGYRPDEAAREASRCLRCECMACVKKCLYLQKYGGYPRVYARQIYNNASIVKGEHLANALINGCMLCGQCSELCPEAFSMADLCLSARRDMVRRGYMPPSAHEFALEDMESANADSCALFMGDPAGKANRYAFFPGCQLSASRGEQVLKSHAFLRGLPSLDGEESGVALFLFCCGAPARWAGAEKALQNSQARIRLEWERFGKPTLIMACASCMKLFRESLPDIPLVSLWEVLDRHYADGHCENGPPSAAGTTYCVHDPCAARHDPAWQKAVRGLARRCGHRLEEPARTGRETVCCGYGGLVWCAQPGLAAAAAGQRAGELGDTALASCIMCRDMLAGSGRKCLHLLDLLPFAQNGDPEAAALSPPPGLSARRANRAALRDRLDQLYHGGESAPAASRLAMAPELLARLEDKHILRQDVEEAVLELQRTKNRFLERRSGHYVGARRPRNVTFWVRYSMETDGSCLLHDAWCHRMTPHGAGTKTGAGPGYAPDEGDWICEACGRALEQRKTQIFYLESAFDVSLPACPGCGLILTPKSLAEGKMLEVEALLEDK